MSDIKISALPAGTVDSTLVFPADITVTGSPVTKKFTIGDLVSYITPSISFPRVVGTPVNLTGQSASVASLATFTLTAADGTFVVEPYLLCTAQTGSKAVTISVAFTDVHGSPQTANSVALSAVGYNGIVNLRIRAQGGSTITVSANLSGAGTITYDAGATFVQINNS